MASDYNILAQRSERLKAKQFLNVWPNKKKNANRNASMPEYVHSIIALDT